MHSYVTWTVPSFLHYHGYPHFALFFDIIIRFAFQMEDKYDWEVWDPTSLSFRQHTIAGIAAGVSEHIVFFPIDTLRVRIRCENDE